MELHLTLQAMKRIILNTIVLLLFSTALHGQYYSPIFVTPSAGEAGGGAPEWDENLEHWWSFDEASGDFEDSHGTNDLTVTLGRNLSEMGLLWW